MSRKRKIIHGYQDKQDSEGLWVKSWPVKIEGDEYMSHQMSLSVRRWNYIQTRCRLRSSNPTGFGELSACGFKDFQEFAEWSQTQVGYSELEIIGGRMQSWSLDKDLLSKTIKVYSPETCLFVPCCVNAFLTNSKQRGDKLLGVTKSSKNTFQVKMGGQYIGNYTSPLEGHLAWVEAKAAKAKEMAQDFKISHSKLYEALNLYSEKLYSFSAKGEIYVG